MKKLFLAALYLVQTLSSAQSTTWSTEFQTSFIDISGLFGLNEPAQVTTIQYKRSNLFVDGFHSFSWREPGKTIQTFFGAGYVFKLDSAAAKTISLKNDFAFNRVAGNGSFLRPMIIGKWAANPKHTLFAVAWVFMDTRDKPAQPLNGGTAYLAHAYGMTAKTWKFRNELRLLFAKVNGVRSVGGVVNQLKISQSNVQLYIVGNVGHSFYRSDGLREWIWNVGLGKQF